MELEKFDKPTESYQPRAQVDKDLQSLIPAFLKNRQKEVEELRLGLEQQDFQTLERIGHILKGVAPSYGFEKLGEYGSLLEVQSKAKAKAECTTIIENIAYYVKNVTLTFI